ncbi:glycosyltransferase [Promineifilum sp.]|uniref:glycosyltransferase n=1 Tax=Promineifilum sp. TaxID=2664178 RepID=UPI0035B3EE1F
MARILLLTPQLPYPPHQGTSLRNFHILRALAERHQVTLLSFAEGDGPPDLAVLRSLARVLPPVAVPPPRSAGRRLRQLATTREPDVALRLRDPAFPAALAAALRADAYDAVQVEGIELAHTIPTIRAARARIVLDCHNAETELQRRAFRADLGRPGRWPAAAYSRLQTGRLARFERWALGAADAVIAVSEADRDHLRRLWGAGAGDITVIPNTIDVGEYEWAGPVPDAARFDLVFTGKMDYRPNVDGMLWFAEAVWPLIAARRPGTTWGIVGQRPHPRLEALRALPGVTVTGRVERVQPYLAGGAVYILPLRVGSGTRLKLIESMAASKAIVSTTVGAEGFPVADGRELLLADAPAAFAEAVVGLLGDPGRRRELGAAARVFAARYDWRETVVPLAGLYERLLTPIGR